MFVLQVLALFFCLVGLVFVSWYAAHTAHPFRSALISVLSGVVALAAVNLLAGYTGFGIALNLGTSFAAVVLGVPGILTLLVLRFLLLF